MPRQNRKTYVALPRSTPKRPPALPIQVRVFERFAKSASYLLDGLLDVQRHGRAAPAADEQKGAALGVAGAEELFVIGITKAKIAGSGRIVGRQIFEEAQKED